MCINLQRRFATTQLPYTEADLATIDKLRILEAPGYVEMLFPAAHTNFDVIAQARAERQCPGDAQAADGSTLHLFASLCLFQKPLPENSYEGPASSSLARSMPSRNALATSEGMWGLGSKLVASPSPDRATMMSCTRGGKTSSVNRGAPTGIHSTR